MKSCTTVVFQMYFRSPSEPVARQQLRTRSMNCIRTDENGESRLVIDGALDALTVRDIRPVIDAVVADRPRRVTVDIENLSLIDSSGVGAIVSLFKRVKAN